jgi:peptidoglycan/LPS O-acetylase OafA/YrhL
MGSAIHSPSPLLTETEVRLTSPLTSAKRIMELDGLRGIAILLVLIWHFFAFPLRDAHRFFPRIVATAGILTWSGVDLFFVLSGFLIGGILLDSADSPRYFKVFYLRRFYRIVPIYALTLLAFWIGCAWFRKNPSPLWSLLFSKPMPWYAYASYLQNLWMAKWNTLGAGWMAATWSLSVEEQFYLGLPILVKSIKTSRLLWLLLLLVLNAPILRTLLYFMTPVGLNAAYVLMPCRADALLLGVTAAILLRRGDVWEWLVQNHGKLFQVSLLLGAGVVLFIVRGWGRMTLPMVTLGYTWMAMFYLSILLLAILPGANRLKRCLRVKYLTGLGTISYGVYLIHGPIYEMSYALLKRESPALRNYSDLGVTLLVAFLTIAIATLSWKFFEKPLVRRGHTLTY